MKHKLYSLIVAIATFAFLMLWSLAAFAADGAAASDPAWLTQLTQAAFDIIVPVVALFVMWGAHRLIKVFEEKSGVDIPEHQEKMIDQWISVGIHWAEEKARTASKKGTDRVGGPQKLDMVVSLVLGFVQSKGWDEWTRDKLIAKIEGKLGMMRANGGKPDLVDK